MDDASENDGDKEGEEDESPEGEQKFSQGGSGTFRPKLPRPEGPSKCPRCHSEDTKFCYYNNYNIKQPRHFCKVWPRNLCSSVLPLLT
jgi:hypothetical protein